MRQYKIVILGPSGSGKTVYLGSFFHKLCTPGELGYYLKVPFSQEKKLTNIFSTTASAQAGGWNKGTAIDQTDIWHFDVMVRASDGRIYTALKMRYYDYAGGRITDAMDAETERETEEILQGADVLVGLLDGEELYKYLVLRTIDVNAPFWDHLKTLCTQMTSYQNKSLHFVVSKWDLFPDSDSTILSIRNALLSFEPFKNLVNDRKGQGLIRLIPISSVGYGFAELKDGKMEVKPGIRPKPLYVEKPFACTLPDLIEAESKKAQAEAEKRARELDRVVKPNLSWWESLGAWLGESINRAAATLGIDQPLLKWVAERAQRSARMKIMEAADLRRLNQAEAAKLRQEVNSDQSAMKFVISTMLSAVDELDLSYPSGRLS